MTVDEALELARVLSNSGRFQRAVELCSKILSADPGHAGALHLLGILAYRQEIGSSDAMVAEGGECRSRFRCRKKRPGNVLMEEGRTGEAIAEYGRAIRIAPDFPEAHNNLGNALQIAGSLEESVRCYQRALGISPRYAEAHRNLGSALRRLFGLGRGSGDLFSDSRFAESRICRGHRAVIARDEVGLRLEPDRGAHETIGGGGRVASGAGESPTYALSGWLEVCT